MVTLALQYEEVIIFANQVGWVEQSQTQRA